MKPQTKFALPSVTLAGAALIAPVAANAALSDCPTGHMCMWANNDYKFMIGNRTAGSNVITNVVGDNNNEMDSWANKSSLYAGCMYGGSNGTGDRQQMNISSSGA